MTVDEAWNVLLRVMQDEGITGRKRQRIEDAARAYRAALSPGPEPVATAWTDQLSGEHEPHRGNHDGYACGFSGPHCWKCGEPWPCRAERGVTVGPHTPDPSR